MASPTLSVVLPCYNESNGIDAILKRFAEVGTDVEFELILVDNGSTDDTAETMKRLLPHYPFARCVTVEVNQGYGHGLATGLAAAQGEALAWSHADLQTDPQDVFRALEIYNASSEPEKVLVKGARRGRGLSAQIISWGMQLIATILFRRAMHEINAQPKLFHHSLRDLLTEPPVDFNFDVYVLVVAKRNGWQVKSFPVEFPDRQYGESNWSATWRSKIRTIRRSFFYMLRLSLQSS